MDDRIFKNLPPSNSIFLNFGNPRNLCLFLFYNAHKENMFTLETITEMITLGAQITLRKLPPNENHQIFKWKP